MLSLIINKDFGAGNEFAQHYSIMRIIRTTTDSHLTSDQIDIWVNINCSNLIMRFSRIINIINPPLKLGKRDD
ncbi:MAG TPA: hypothetical protein DER52_08465 [Glaciecola sp.]|nr:hypothetical protein [Glaciecola sp.]